MTTRRLISRRLAIKEMGKAGLAVMVLGTAACANDAGEGTTSTTARPATTTSTAPPTTVADTTSSTTTIAPPAGASFQRVDLSFVSAYILYRAGEAALVDTGVDGSADAIEASLAEVGLGWEAVGHVILTHKHPDHVGSIDDVLERAPGAMVYAGAADIPAISSSLAPVAIGDGGTVFGLEIIGTPGHTAGHISVLDSVAGILVAGDALNGTGGGVAGPDPGFSEDMAIAIDSVGKLAGLDYEVALFGHGDPVLEGASTAVADLAAGL
ncbi:MAG TPA: MBL fold metallo-hydrolase [Acidimicrobiia bacterium]|nr:MBL fold metallo-hydrolase [Acidimicrobiia bacterium]